MLGETDVMIINKREGSTNKTVIQYASVHEERIYAAITFFFFLSRLHFTEFHLTLNSNIYRIRLLIRPTCKIGQLQNTSKSIGFNHKMQI